MSRKYKFGMIGIALLALLLLGLLAFGLRPLHYQQKISVCTLEGDVLEVHFDITLRRYFWKPMESHGKIIIDGVEYINMNDLYSKSSLKNNGSHIFLIPSQYALDSWDNDRIYLNPIDNRLDGFMFSFVKSGDIFTYFGPADSQDAAQTIAEKW